MLTRRVLLRACVLMSVPLSFAAAQEAVASLHGTVSDSIRHGPLAGATVVASPSADSGAGNSREYTTTTDAKGRYAIKSLRPATYVLTVEHPWLDSTGLSVPARAVDLRTSSAASVNLAVPSRATILAMICKAPTSDSTVGLVAGYVKETTSERPVSGARVVFVWNDFDVDRRTAKATQLQRTATATTGSDGTFRMCGLPVMRPILMQAQAGDKAATGAEELELPTSGVMVKTLRIEARPAGVAELTGVVLRTVSQHPLAGAHVHLYGAPDSVVTSDDGTFRLDRVPLGTQSVEITALGYYPRRYSLDVTKNGTKPISITMSEIAATLDSVRIIAQRTNTPPWYAEFEDRRAHGFGQYITEAMIAHDNPMQTSDMLRTVNGFYVMEGKVFSSRGITTLRGNRICSPTVYVDGFSAQSIDDIPPMAIHGIEVYPSAAEAPAKYHVGNCGAILIWTK